MNLRIKICGITQSDQAQAIADLGASALGFICVPQSPRYIPPAAIQAITTRLPETNGVGLPLARIGVFANASLDTLMQTLAIAPLTGVQLHGDESVQFCWELRQLLPVVEIIKALRVRSPQTLMQVHDYQDVVDTLLLDAYSPQAWGGTGTTWNWDLLQGFQPGMPWLLAGGLTPDNVVEAVQRAQPEGIDLSSGVERSPGDKDLSKVKRLVENLCWARLV